MSFFALANDPLLRASRRNFLSNSGLVLSGAAVALLAGRDALAATGGTATEADARILNTALGAELEAVAAYQVGAESGLLAKPALDLALAFQGHHKEHADVLAKTIEKLGGKPVAAKAKYSLAFMPEQVPCFLYSWITSPGAGMMSSMRSMIGRGTNGRSRVGQSCG